jgi:glycine/D-amino acid oxidase-like deaminating enzyme
VSSTKLLIVGGGLFGSQAAAYARSRGIEAVVFDAGCAGAASPAAAGLFLEAWAGARLREHFQRALPILDRLYGIRHVELQGDDGARQTYLCVPPAAILEPQPLRQHVSAVGDGWLEADGCRHAGWVYVAAGVWCEALLPGAGIYGKAGAAFVFPGERPGRVRQLERGRQAVAFVRDPGATYFGDGTAEREYGATHEQRSLELAATLGLVEPCARLWGWRPYARGGLVFRRVGERTWVGSGGRKMGTVLGAYAAWRLGEELGMVQGR